MGLAIASALVVLVASGVAVSRLGSDPTDRDAAGAADPAAQQPGSPASGATAAGEGAGPAATGAGGALSSASAPVPPPVPASGTGRKRTGRSNATGTGSPASTADRAASAPGESTPASSQPAGAGGSMGGSSGDPAGPGGQEIPGPRGGPDPASLAAASASVGEGEGGAVFGVGLGGAQPEVDLTVGTHRLVGDAPPSQGTGIGFGGSFLNPPPTVPLLPG